jgi:hypothetical protein
MKCAEKFNLLRLKKMCMDEMSTTHVDVPESTFALEMRKAVNSAYLSDVTFLVEGKPR